MLQKIAVFALDHFESADAAADVDTDRLGDIRCDLRSPNLHRKVARGDSEVDEPAHLLDFFLVNVMERIEVLDFTGDAAVIAGGIELRDGTDSVAACENSPSTFPPFPIPKADNKPTPVTTTLREICISLQLRSLLLRGLRFDVVHSVFYRVDLLCVLIGNFEVKRFFERHHEFDDVERIRTQIVNERRIIVDLVLVHAELLDNDLLYLRFNWGSHLSSWGKRTGDLRFAKF